MAAGGAAAARQRRVTHEALLTDYRTFWQAQGAVFLGPPETLFVPQGLQALMDRLPLLTTGHASLVVVTGEPGAGKSTLARWLYESLPQDSHDVLLVAMVQREIEGGWLAPRLMELLGLPPTDVAADALRQVVGRLDDLVADGRRLVVVVDAAHLASTPDALGEIAGLLNLQTLASACLTFVLIGDGSLLATLDEAPDLRAKISMAVPLRGLTARETGEYLAARASQIGLASPFDAGALAAIHARTRGLMGLVNVYAEHCLIEAAGRGVRVIDADVARAAAHHLPPEASPDKALRRPPLPPAHHPDSPGEPSSRRPSTETVAIKLTSLFKSEPGRDKP